MSTNPTITAYFKARFTTEGCRASRSDSFMIAVTLTGGLRSDKRGLRLVGSKFEMFRHLSTHPRRNNGLSVLAGMISLCDMQQHPTELLIEIMARLSDLKENAVHHREQPGPAKTKWPDKERKDCAERLREGLEWLDKLRLQTTSHHWQQLAQEILHLPPQSALTLAESVRRNLELELKTQRFFVLNPDDNRFYDNRELAGDRFRNNWPNANTELTEAGNCFALDRHTACVCHLMRSLEYALKAFEAELKITPPTAGYANTWGKIIARIEGKRFNPGTKTVTADWVKNAEFYDTLLSYFSAAKSACRDKTFHVEASYGRDSSKKMLDCVVAVLAKSAEHLREI